MRLKYGVLQRYASVLNFWQDVCSYRGKSACPRGRCCDPAAGAYQKRCDALWKAWHDAGGKGKRPVMPQPAVECEKCNYSDLTTGSVQGNASLKTIVRHVEGTVPVPVAGRKKIWLDNVNREQLARALADASPNVESFAITGSPTIDDFSFLQSFPRLKHVYVWWNHRAKSLWDFTKTPAIEFLQLDDVHGITDLSQLKNANNLRYLKVLGGKTEIESFRPLENHPALELVSLWRKTADLNMRSFITIPNLKYLDCHFNLFPAEAYAEFEAKRPDVDTNFWEGIEDYVYDEPVTRYHVGLVGSRQGLANYTDREKQEKHKRKYAALKQKYLTDL